MRPDRFRWTTPFLAAVAVLFAASHGSGSEPVVSEPRAALLLVRGAPGTDEFERMFAIWESRWREAAHKGDVTVRTIGTEANVTPIDELQTAIREESEDTHLPLWIVLIGHGTFDGRDAKFNLAGPDVSADDFAKLLEPIRRPMAVINCSAASGPFLSCLSTPGRIVITATKTGSEVNFARFGEHFSRAISERDADLDKDGQVSLLEAFLTASRQTRAWYEGRQQLPTEHALLDDNGDGLGVREDFFDGLLPVTAAADGASLDGQQAQSWYLIPSDEERSFPADLRERRAQLETEMTRLRARKSDMDEDQYYTLLEELLVELAELYEHADEQSDGDTEVLTPPSEVTSP